MLAITKKREVSSLEQTAEGHRHGPNHQRNRQEGSSCGGKKGRKERRQKIASWTASYINCRRGDRKKILKPPSKYQK